MLAVIEVIGVIVVPIAIFVFGYFIKSLHSRITDVKDAAVKRQDQMREDALRDVDRIDRDISTLRNDITKNFDVIRTQMSEDKREILDEIRRSK